MLAPVVRLARHHYHVVVLLLSKSCVPSAVLVKELDPLRTGTCATGLTLLFTSLMSGGSGKADPCNSPALLSAQTLGPFGNSP